MQFKSSHPLDRLKKREERRREFERQAAARYGGNPYNVDHRAHQYNMSQSNDSNINQTTVRPLFPHQLEQRHQANQRFATPNKPPSPGRWSSAGSYNRPQTQTTQLNSARGYSPPTPTYPIPKPPIPGEAQNASTPASLSDQLNLVFKATSKPDPKPVAPPPADPRALLPLPDSLRSPPKPIIPAKPQGKTSLLPEPKSLLEEPVSLLPDPDSLFGEPDALLPDPSATELPDNSISRSLSTTSANRDKSAPIKGLLPNPDTIPGHSVQQGLLPDPTSPGLSVSDAELTATRAKHEQFRDILDEDDWRIISQPSAPINKLKTSGSEDVDYRIKHSSSREKRHSKTSSGRESVEDGDKRLMPADSTSEGAGRLMRIYTYFVDSCDE